MPGGLTMTEAYIERVNQVGNVARQAAIAQQALEVVYEQAKETRDGISGVSLDEEASALVRFQQAYQANAKVMQTANTLFDALLAIR
jgi:flagellar hook-associated protein FlgK